MNIAVVLVLFIVPDNFLNACDINLAWRPTWESPISPSISAWGTNAATESITTISTASLLTKASQISRASSPVSGWLSKSSLILTPNF